IKYDLDKELTSKIISEFSRENSSGKLLSILGAKTTEEFERLKQNYEKPSIVERIRIFCTENNVEQSIIASLLIDYNIWYEAQDDEIN
ncbi:hypothetical protein ACFL2X_07255, partial [Candidatus Latescibacterota bacterium]